MKHTKQTEKTVVQVQDRDFSELKPVLLREGVVERLTEVLNHADCEHDDVSSLIAVLLHDYLETLKDNKKEEDAAYILESFVTAPKGSLATSQRQIIQNLVIRYPKLAEKYSIRLGAI